MPTKIKTYSDYQALEASEKEGLIILEASKRLVGWTLSSGAVYHLTNFNHVLSPDSPLQDSGVALTEAASLAAITAGSFYHDRQAKTLYLQTSDSVNPSGKFISVTFRLFFSKSGRNLPHDLSTGFEVHWNALLKDTSDFGVEIDNQNQLGSAIEGSGKISLYNEQDFWRPIYDKYYFENQRAFVYSWNPFLPITEAKLIYRGRVQKKTYTPSQITFDLQDAINELRAPVGLSFLSDVSGARIPDSLQLAFQRRLYGYVNGHRPTNIDQVLDGYLITGTISATSGDPTITGSGTAFLTELSPDDELTIFDAKGPKTFSVQSVESDTGATLTENYSGSTASGLEVKNNPDRPTRMRNRQFLISGHALCQPTTAVTRAINTTMIEVGSVQGMLPGDSITVGSEKTSIVRISGSTLKLSTSLATTPDVGTQVVRVAVSNVYLNDRRLTLDVDYTYDAAAGTLTLDPLAEVNVASPKKLRGTVSFTSGSRNITGTSTAFTADLNPGDWVKAVGEADYFEVLSITDDTNAVLRSASTYTASVAALIKRPDYYDEGTSILCCDVLGTTDDDTTSGSLLKSAPEIAEDLLKRAGLTAILDQASFDTAKTLTSKRLGLAIPKTFSDKKAPILRDVINEINKSDFGSLVQNESFNLEYHILSPEKPASLTRFSESDAISFAIESNSQNIVKTCRINYGFKEVDALAGDAVNSQAVKTSDAAQFLAGATKEFLLDTLLVDEADAQIYANRWSFIFEVASSVVKLGTKLQGATLQIGDKVELSHEKLYERIGSSAKRKIAGVTRAKKSLEDASLELDDLSNAFSRCAVIAADTASDYASANEAERAVNGYVTDDYGMQDNNPDTFGINLIW